eukprot:COSAG06_NODE_64897_length_258_cov_0.685535_1_plen_60_part_10
MTATAGQEMESTTLCAAQNTLTGQIASTFIALATLTVPHGYLHFNREGGLRAAAFITGGI